MNRDGADMRGVERVDFKGFHDHINRRFGPLHIRAYNAYGKRTIWAHLRLKHFSAIVGWNRP